MYPSRFEAFGLPPLEAMACGRAVVVSRVGAVDEYGIHGKNILIVNPEARELVEAILSLIERDDLREKLQAEARKAAARWTWDRAIARLEAHLREVLGG